LNSKALPKHSSKSKVTNSWGGDSVAVTIKEQTPWTVADFESVFGGSKGVKIQPTKEIKPT